MKEWKKRNAKVLEVFQNLIDTILNRGYGGHPQGSLEKKGWMIKYEDNAGHFYIELGIRLIKAGVDANKIRHYTWKLHDFIVVDDDIILDSQFPEGIPFSRNNLDTLFMFHASKLALEKGRHYYLVAKNEHVIIHDPWEFVDDREFDHDAFKLRKCIETVESGDIYID